MRHRLPLAVLLGGLVVGCATDTPSAYTKDGVTYGVTDGSFRGRWWSYYERGTSFQNGDFHQEAAQDFETALALRSEDSWRARTYGLHFAEYFPNRELGISHFRSGDLEQAEQYLLTSLGQVDTARAHYYLDEVKKAKIAKGIINDGQAPGIKTALQSGALVNSRVLELGIATQDDTGVSEVRVNGELLHQRGSAEQVAFDDSLLFYEGTHEVGIMARDLADKQVEEKLSVTVDLTGPTVGIFSPLDGAVVQGDSVMLRAVAADHNGLQSIRLDEAAVTTPEGAAKHEFEHLLNLKPGENQFIVIALDRAGNETRTAVRVFQGSASSPQAQAWSLRERGLPGLQLATADMLTAGILHLAQADPAAAAAAGSEIVLKSPSAERPYRHNKTLRVAGEITVPTKLASLSINGQTFDPLTGAPKESFNRNIPIDAAALESGSTKIPVAVEATDDAGNKYTKNVEVEVRPVMMDTRESRMPVAVLAFAGQGIDPAQAELLRVTTEQQLVAQERFRILDRTQLQEILVEQELVAAALTDPNEAIRLGKLSSAHVFLVADIFPHEAKGLEIKARAISTETSDIVATLDVFIADKDSPDAIKEGCDALAEQLGKTFPRLSGEVLGVRGKELLVNWTKEDGVREGTYMLVVKEEEPWKDETTGEILEPGQLVEVGRGRLTTISATSTRAETTETKEEAPLEKGMPAISM